MSLTGSTSVSRSKRTLHVRHRFAEQLERLAHLALRLEIPVRNLELAMRQLFDCNGILQCLHSLHVFRSYAPGTRARNGKPSRANVRVNASDCFR